MWGCFSNFMICTSLKIFFRFSSSSWVLSTIFIATWRQRDKKRDAGTEGEVVKRDGEIKEETVRERGSMEEKREWKRGGRQNKKYVVDQLLCVQNRGNTT